MKISNSKKQLAEIIHENGGWRDGCDFVVQDKDSFVCFYEGKPTRCGDAWKDIGDCQYRCGFDQGGTIQNWHQTLISREEYFYLHPAPVAVTVENKTACHLTVTDKPTIEQLAADYRAKLAIATQAQEEADSHRCGAEVALSKLEIAVKELGFSIEPITAKQEPELVITDWRQWRVGDVVSWSLLSHAGEFEIISVHHDQSRNIGDFEVKDKPGDVYRVYGDECRFIRRP